MKQLVQVLLSTFDFALSNSTMDDESVCNYPPPVNPSK